MSASYPHPIIAREGWPFLAATLVVAVASGWLIGWWSAPIWLAVLFVQAPGDAHTVVSPADGRIVAVERARDPYLERNAIKISVFMNVFNVHSNRSPVDGRVQKRWYHPGRFINAAFDKASLENERNALWLRTTRGADVTCVQVAGLIARRILCYVNEGDSLARGQRFGFIRFGSRVDIYVPENADLVAALGDKVYATRTVIATLPHHA